MASEFIVREDFQDWLVSTEQALPSFWFTDSEQQAVDSTHRK
jgi:hypothetical protein